MADRSHLLVFVVVLGAMFSILYLAGLLSPPSHAHFDKIPVEPKKSPLEAVQTAERHLLSRLPEIKGDSDGARLFFPLYNFSAQRYNTDQEYAAYLNEHYRQGWPLSQVKQNPELLDLSLFFIHHNKTMYFVNSTSQTYEEVCEKPSQICPLPAVATIAAKDRLVYRIVLMWTNSSVPLNESLYLVDAETGELVWNYLDFESNRMSSLPSINLVDNNKTIRQLEEERLYPPIVTHVDIARGASLESNNVGYMPDNIRVLIGEDNKIVWTNRDLVAHTVVSDNRYSNPHTGKFESDFVEPGETFEYTFFEPGKYQYHCDIHPWIRGTVGVIENFS